MPTKVLVPLNMDVRVSEAVKCVQDQIPADHDVCVVAIVTPDTTEEGRAEAISTLLRRLMSLRTRGVTTEGEVDEAESESQGLINAAASFGADEILMRSGSGKADRTALIEELRASTGLPVTVVAPQEPTYTAS